MRSVTHLLRLARDGWAARSWYNEAQKVIESHAYKLKVSPVELASVLAITSPRCTVRHNVRVTLHYLTTGVLPTSVTRNTGRALDHWRATGVIRGIKTSEFKEALLGNQDAIVLDTWMARALGIPQRSFDNKAVRERCRRRIRFGAYVMDWTPAQFQAAVWSGQIKRANRNPADMAQILKLEVERHLIEEKLHDFDE
jgi:hypothetical protein